MVFREEILRCLENECPESLAISASLLKRACLEYFILFTSGDVDKNEAKAVKAELDALCRVVSHIELVLKPSNTDKE